MADVNREVRTRFTGDDTDFKQKARSVGAGHKKLLATVTAVSTGFLAARRAALDMVAGIDALVGSTIRAAGEFQKFEQRLGISASVLSELKFAA